MLTPKEEALFAEMLALQSQAPHDIIQAKEKEEEENSTQYKKEEKPEVEEREREDHWKDSLLEKMNEIEREVTRLQ